MLLLVASGVVRDELRPLTRADVLEHGPLVAKLMSTQLEQHPDRSFDEVAEQVVELVRPTDTQRGACRESSSRTRTCTCIPEMGSAHSP